ncbi:MAG: putative coat protein [Perrunavirus faecihabitans]|uniref:Coat protein n=1 Tax=Leviviridae sp. TaxID=2027243 RepID=A0ABY3SUI9_9VIRU|nr:MAG: putative coat protein [Leviviridae sp.]
MAQLQQLILKDEKAESLTFVPRDIRNGVGTVVNTTGSPIGESKFSISLRATQTGRYKAAIKFQMPVVVEATVNGVPKQEVAHTMYANLEFDYARLSTTEQREKFVQMLADALKSDKALVKGSVVDLEGVY